MPRPPGWLIYPVLLIALLATALDRRTHADSPPPPPLLPPPERAVLAETTPIDPAVLVRVRARRGPNAGAAFSIGEGGLWVTAARSAGCARPAVLVNDLEGVAARAAPGPLGQLTVLVTPKGAAALPLASAPPPARALGYAPGFVAGRPAEAALHLLGARSLNARGRRAEPTPVLAWAEMGRTEGLKGPLTGLTGAPILDGEGRVVGVVLGEAPRRGRVYAAGPATILGAIAAAKAAPPVQASGAAISPDDYGLAADQLRRSLRVAPVACIRR